jgi:hypothetical protein
MGPPVAPALFQIPIVNEFGSPGPKLTSLKFALIDILLHPKQKLRLGGVGG